MGLARVFLIAILIPEFAFANSMAPALPLVSMVGWLALPLIIGIEGWLWRRKGLRDPFKFSLLANIRSALVGIPLAVAGLFFPIPGPMVEVDYYLRNGRDPTNLILYGLAGFMASVVLNYWISSVVEYRFAKNDERWKENLPAKRAFYLVHAVSYGLIALVFIVAISKQLLYVREKLRSQPPVEASNG